MGRIVSSALLVLLLTGMFMLAFNAAIAIHKKKHNRS